MHRTHQGGLLALGLVAAMSWTWWAAVPFAWALALTRSLTGWLAATAGLVVLMPSLWWAGLLACPILVAVRYRLAPGAIGDTTRARLLSAVYLIRDAALIGRGPGSARLALEAAHIRSGGRALDGGPARNEWLEVVYEYGLLAVLPLMALAMLVSTRLHLGDPLAAVLVTASLVCAMTSPLRAFWAWLRGDRATLFGPPLRASISLHLDQEGNAYVYGGDLWPADRETKVAVARALARLCVAMTDEYGITAEELEHGTTR